MFVLLHLVRTNKTTRGKILPEYSVTFIALPNLFGPARVIVAHVLVVYLADASHKRGYGT